MESREDRRNPGGVPNRLAPDLLKCELRLAHFREHGAVPDGVTPSWLLERTLNQIAGVLAGLDGFYRSALRPAFGRPRYRRRAR